MDITSKKIAVIGGAGLVGSHIVDQLTREPVSEIIVYDNFVRGTDENLAQAVRDSKVRVVKASMTDPESLRRELAGVDGVFLLASLWLGECVNDPRSAWEVNVLGSWNVIEACRELGIQRVVYSSSASVYGNALFTPMTEEHPFNNRTTYGATKIAVEQMFRSIYEQHKLPYVGYRYMNVYGPRMDYEGTYVSVIMKALDRIFAGQPPIIYGDGSQMYDFIYVEDVAEANILGMKADCADEFFNIGKGVGTTINELVDMLLELTGSTLKPEYRPQEQSFVTQRIGTTEKAERLLGFKARTPLLDGLRRVVEWRKSRM
ncbi:MAG: NAD-dependent dehydratase [Anaerolineae bacterium]|nr:MAG: NAD-dependent dehydratase [Anaerolineae bacterium]WKZ43905.1 MAG: NAD-dependent epimerase/dehydratase family protein [Anaerolineales bacterium]